MERRASLRAGWRGSGDIAAEGVENVHVIVGDGSEGAGAVAPYDAIVVAAAHPLAWLVEVDGFIVDARRLPPEPPAEAPRELIPEIAEAAA